MSISENLSTHLHCSVILLLTFSKLVLNNGTMFAYFHSKGTTLSFNDRINTLTSNMLNCSTVSISSFDGIPPLQVICYPSLPTTFGVSGTVMTILSSLT